MTSAHMGGCWHLKISLDTKLENTDAKQVIHAGMPRNLQPLMCTVSYFSVCVVLLFSSLQIDGLSNGLCSILETLIMLCGREEEGTGFSWQPAGGGILVEMAILILSLHLPFVIFTLFMELGSI